MSVATVPSRLNSRARAGLGQLIALLGVALLGVALAVGLSAQPLPLWAVIGAAVGILGSLALTLWRFDWAVALAFGLFAVERFEPAPVDGLLAVIVVISVVTGQLRLSEVPLAMAGLIAAFLGLNLIAMMEAVDLPLAVMYLSVTAYLCLFGLWVCAYVDSRRRAALIVRIYVGVAALFAGLGTLALFVPFPGSDLLLLPDGERVRGLFGDPNVYGPFLVPAAAFVMQELLTPRLLRARRSTKLVLLLVICTGVIFSFSRAAWLNLAVAGFVILAILPLRRGGGRRATVMLCVVIIGIAGVTSAVAFTDSGEFLRERARFQSYDSDRFGAQASGIKLGERYPLGVGPGQFEIYEPISAHSTYVRAIAEEGVVGMAVLVAILGGTFLLALRNAALGQDTWGIGSTALLGTWCGLLANSFFIDTLHWRHLWLVAGLIWGGAVLARRAGLEPQVSSATGALGVK